MDEAIDWRAGKMNYLEGKGRAFRNQPQVEPNIDAEVSRIVGKKIFVNDRKLIEWSAKKIRERDPNELDPRPLLDSEENKEELRILFS